MSNFWMRTLTGAVFLIVMIGGIAWNFWSCLLLFSLIALLGLWEFFSLLKEKMSRTQRISGMLMGLIVLLAVAGKYFHSVPPVFYSKGIVIILLLFPAFLLYKLFQPVGSFSIFSPVMFGILYIVFPFSFLVALYSYENYGSAENNSRIILGFFFLIWSNDTFAYLVGRSIGRTKLFERISPKKTWEGTVGGAICTGGIAYVLSIYFTEIPLRDWIAIGLIVSVFGTLGDLVESLFKRSLGVKDSGNILPGHGGILDRFDAVLIASPVVAAYLMLVR